MEVLETVGVGLIEGVSLGRRLLYIFHWVGLASIAYVEYREISKDLNESAVLNTDVHHIPRAFFCSMA